MSRKLLYSVVVVTLILVASLVTYYLFFQPRVESWTAALIDQVTIEEGLFNADFNATITSLLNASKFDVKYYPGEDTNVTFYRDLPSKGNKIIILRAHSAVRSGSNSDFVDLFTSESYSTQKEIQYSSYGNQISVALFLGTDHKYFAVGPTFVDLSMRGRFDSACVIILMGCDSLNKTTMAEALVRRGATVVIGWTLSAELSDADESTLELLQYLLVNEYNIEAAVNKINQRYHPSGTTLDYYPKTAGNYIVSTRESETPQALRVGLFQPSALTTTPKRKPSSMDAFFS